MAYPRDGATQWAAGSEWAEYSSIAAPLMIALAVALIAHAACRKKRSRDIYNPPAQRTGSPYEPTTTTEPEASSFGERPEETRLLGPDSEYVIYAADTSVIGDPDGSGRARDS